MTEFDITKVRRITDVRTRGGLKVKVHGILGAGKYPLYASVFLEDGGLLFGQPICYTQKGKYIGETNETLLDLVIYEKGK